MTTDQATVLRFLRDGFKLRVRSGIWRLKQSDYVDRFEECPGGNTRLTPLMEVVGLRHDRDLWKPDYPGGPFTRSVRLLVVLI